jgi:KDO2-lipid IV(A) lauroyltransferase
MRRRLKLMTRPLRNVIAVPILEGFRLASQLLPHGAGLSIGGWIGRGIAFAAIPLRRLAQRQLERAGIAGTPEASRRLSAEVFAQLGMSAVEAMHSLRWTPKELREHVRIPRLDTLQSAIRENKRGLILVSAHMGNWELLGRVGHAYTGLNLASAMASQNNDLVTRWLIRWREATGQVKMLPASETLAMVRHLRAGGVLAMITDQDSTRSRGIFVDFFGQPAYTPAGPAHLARRTGIPLLPLVIVREPDDPRRHMILIDEPIRPDPQLDEDADIQRMTQAYTRVLEDWIRQYPGQWVWVHNRRRHRPGQKIVIRSAQGSKEM